MSKKLDDCPGDAHTTQTAQTGFEALRRLQRMVDVQGLSTGADLNQTRRLEGDMLLNQLVDCDRGRKWRRRKITRK
jgi:hypothetical protein